MPFLQRVVRKLLPKSYWMLPLLLVLFLVIFPLQRHYFPHTADNKFGVFFGVFASAFAVGVCIVEFSLRPFFPLRRADKES